MVPTTKAEVPVLEGSIGLGTEGRFPEESMASEVKVEAPLANHETLAPTAAVLEPSCHLPTYLRGRTSLRHFLLLHKSHHQFFL